MNAFLPATILLLASAAYATPPAESSAAAKQAIRSAMGAILQADGGSARASLVGIPAGSLSAKDAGFRACALARIDGTVRDAVPTASIFARRTLVLYREYWRSGLASPADRVRAEQRLVRNLAALLGDRSIDAMDTVEPLLAKRLARDGLHSLQGKTGLLRELMIWVKQEDRTETVTLPEREEAMRVVYMDAFLSRGWSAYFTCDRTGTGGWTRDDGLYAVVPSYESLSNENFRVTFLGHESQHFADRRDFPGIAAWELEYRAKLVELAFAVETKDRLLDRFSDSQGDDPADAHSYANKRVLAALRAQLNLPADGALSSISTVTLQAAAVAALLADTALRQRE